MSLMRPHILKFSHRYYFSRSSIFLSHSCLLQLCNQTLKHHHHIQHSLCASHMRLSERAKPERSECNLSDAIKGYKPCAAAAAFAFMCGRKKFAAATHYVSIILKVFSSIILALKFQHFLCCHIVDMAVHKKGMCS
jgi:hypothetical protein